ncbi:Proline iminopeptidase [Lachnellula willkommii]|uniref:Proline iminopeptidase n=1 Tax=Lachnellula willkommii TaxID=215461 RepID=A0A559MIB7_9HELO|nr:Proline iminopeptidase [Lachnellula willkommii]
MAEIKAATTSTVQMDDGINLRVKVFGEDSKSTKPLLIALHGAPGLSTLAEPEAAFTFLSDLFRVLVFDARGSGGSDLTGPYTHDRWIKDIEILRKWAGAEKFVLAGGSYGGFIALDYAVLHGDKLSGLILRDTWANGVLGMMTALGNVLTDDRLHVDVARQIRVWSGNLRDDKDFEEAIPEIIPIYAPPEEHLLKTTAKDNDESKAFDEMNEVAAFNSAAQNAAFSVNVPRFDVRQQLKDIKAPTLVIVGRHDYVTPVEFSQEIANGIPQSKLEIFEHSGHNPASDETEKYRQVTLDFLRTEVI